VLEVKFGSNFKATQVS